MDKVHCVWPVAAELGEGPFWSLTEKALWFVDIKGRQIHRFDPATGAGRSWPAPDQVSFVLPMADGSFVAGLPGRLARFTAETGEFAPLLSVEQDRPRNRLNDASTDSRGWLWFGTMDDDETHSHGALYSWEGTALTTCDEGFVISNGPAFSPDGRFFYHSDTVARTIYRFDVGVGGSLSGKRPFIEIEEGAGWPDGTAVDAEGRLWIALYGGWAVRCYSPQGDLLETVGLPCAQVTKVAFGGPDLKTAYVTTAWKGLCTEERARQSLAGALFAFDADIPGLPTTPMRESLCLRPAHRSS